MMKNIHAPDLFTIYAGQPRYNAALGVFIRLTKAGFETWFVGGCVRDAFLHAEDESTASSVDFDLASSASPAEISELFDNVVEVGSSFGVIRVIIEDEVIEVAQFRRDGTYSDGRHPDFVVRGTVEEDAARRDFTVNSLYCNPITGEILDPNDGVNDISNRILQFIGDPVQRINEDHLRILRAVRFACVHRLEMNDRTLSAVKDNAQLICAVSAERIAVEIERMLASPNRVCCVKMLDETQLLSLILPEVSNLKGVEQSPKHHPEGDVFVHTMLVLENIPQDASFELALAALLHDIGKPSSMTITDRIRFTKHEVKGAEMAKEICARLRLSRRVTEKVIWLIANHMRYQSLEKMRKGRAMTLLMHPWGAESLALYRADSLASHCKTDTYEYGVKLLSQMAERPRSFVKGSDVLALGVLPGPIVKKVLTMAYLRQLEGEFPTREAALSALQDILEIAREGEDEE